ncbi:hypothetical protein CLAFUW4_03136 [Fulvia fulva]|uniref:Uncharacterized protein n=1 Tax=Passalora fulva TaxID=5499 RepID=A0A9Q8LBW0_PASFU|nr:uncharacterized protein CLAFUR5_03120 [Fulvia fulva]KAK4631692.1 hypothetical protein CLAFUR4_03127 [Fulvia fulva]KAK4633890.1 hypothetical protein CLAFUR0_03132 [Fulvia fulva]UJO14539.1 hypothetical protein CLAFUR5_03120 [Fulvia fulva]WPV10723.1 hypothetical protein CLAFUW4_03136 [Fulvia fulva]WPV25942.1 hypothetical protein CLAFUW7_03131 [Fulvia fulva]
MARDTGRPRTTSSKMPSPSGRPVLYSAPNLDIKYTVCPKSAVASNITNTYTIDINRLRDLHGDKWFDHLLYQMGWKFGNPSTHDMTIHAGGGPYCNGTLCAADVEMSNAATLDKYVFHIHFAKRPRPPPEPVRPYAFDVEEDLAPGAESASSGPSRRANDRAPSNGPGAG